MRYIINDQVVLSRPLEGPLAAHIGSFARWVNEQGYAFCSLRRQVLLAACFSHWLGEKDVRVHSVWSEQAVQYLRYRARRVQIHKGDTAALRYLIEFLNREGVTPVEETAEPRPNPVEQCAGEFESYLRKERVLAEATIINYMPHIRGFLKHRFGDGTVQLSRLCAGDVVGFVQHQAPRLHPKRSKVLTTALRSFLQYARYSGEVDSGFGRCRSSGTQLVEDDASPRDHDGASPSVARQYQPPHRHGAPGLRHLAPARTTGATLKRSGLSRSR